MQINLFAEETQLQRLSELGQRKMMKLITDIKIM